MMTMTRNPGKALVVLLCGSCVALWSACGSQDAPAGTQGASSVEKVVQCLERAQAVLVRDPGQVGRFGEDLSDGKVVKPASAGNGLIELAKYQPAGVAGPSGKRLPPAYIMVVGHPATSDEVDPMQLIDDDRDDTFAAYLRKPTRDQIVSVDRCLINFGA